MPSGLNPKNTLELKRHKVIQNLIELSLRSRRSVKLISVGTTLFCQRHRQVVEQFLLHFANKAKITYMDKSNIILVLDNQEMLLWHSFLSIKPIIWD